ncbi:hypothetical protein BASA50_008333 [Batrachochytrium salamandrivorans]|uniref:Uncharacterized protein n=1 Tax=Batrachochytrium salamandrivorans TaxID=1357716 RepID=A0ABQ8F4I5_9FUNG|nr:hypothetical protein BASA50_008333 [Batrachochytrium salamandrivorans]
MQFLYLFSFVVAASYAAALPQPAGLSEKYSNNADATLASDLEARSYQPGSNSHKDSATLVSLKRRGNYGGSDPSPPSPPSASTPDHTQWGPKDPVEKTEFRTQTLSLMIKELGKGLIGAPKYIEEVGAAVGGTVEETLVEYLRNARQATDSLKNWVNDAEEGLVIAIKSGLGDDEYSKVKSLLDDASEKLKADVSYNLQQVADALSNIKGKTVPVKPELDAVQQALGRVFKDYELYLKAFQHQLSKFVAGQEFNERLAAGVTSLENFSLKQQDLYFTVRNGLNDAPSE